jgi:ankyrin repeat protein
MGMALLLAAGAAVVQAGEAAGGLVEAARARDATRVRRLLAERADPNATTPRGWTPLLEATRQGDLQVARLLLDAGAAVDARDRLEGTPLDVAERGGHQALARLLRDRGARGSGKSVGDLVCVRAWRGDGFCGRVVSRDAVTYSLRLERIHGCGEGCGPEPECSRGRPVGGAGGWRVGETVTVPGSCLTHTGLP